ncbi:hypothetical protein I350_01673 [Cryptococcus amylolentus CBS 6273]|uniref:Uncharacterized protein n=1 Tax=Cryptococcus amylolentus CBS 6273 TaxID=1296118 RepID=A0A1E3KD97_9TREE|nr:hypothetical protein I350_01673 [Cryptococcus amylolentus CBS 6273]
MFTPLSKGSERAQDKLWDKSSPRRTRVRPSLPYVMTTATVQGQKSSDPSSRQAPWAKLRGKPPPGGKNKGKGRETSGLLGTPDPSAVATGVGIGSSSAAAMGASAGSIGRSGGEMSGTIRRGLPYLAPTSPYSTPSGNSASSPWYPTVTKSKSQSQITPSRRRPPRPRRISSEGQDEEEDTWASMFLNPSAKRVEGWMDNLWKRHFVLVILPCLAVWVWVAVPFPVSDPYKDNPFPDIPSWPKKPSDDGEDSGNDGETETRLPLDVNFYFFLFCMYLAAALLFITNLFSLYRLNWWPSKLGGKLSYALSWSITLAIGLAAHHLDFFYLRKRWDGRERDDVDWERKSNFLAMLLPAIACFSKLKRDKRHTYRHPIPAVYQTFFGQAFSRRFPASWNRFLWFMACLMIACFSVVAGQAYASLFLSTLPHTSLDAGTWVWSWVITVQILGQISIFILSAKVRSRALLFIYRLFFQLVYHVFYRNLFARLRSPQQFATVQMLSSISTIIIFPVQMSKPWHRMLQIVVGYPNPWEDHVESVAMGFFCRGLAQNVTMVGFLGWLAILHFGPNSQIYPFFRFHPTPEDPYTFALTFFASCAVWAFELVSSFIARQIMSFAWGVDVSQIGREEIKEYPELVPACGWASVHVSMNILLFLIKLNFR